MNHYSEASLKNREGVDKRLLGLFEVVLPIADHKILEGLRTVKQQRAYYLSGNSKTMESKHLVGRAIHVLPYPFSESDWHNRDYWMWFAGVVYASAPPATLEVLRWGGRWDRDWTWRTPNGWDDLLHWELIR